MTEQRTDAYRPSTIDPADFEFVGAFVNNPPIGPDGEEMIDDAYSPYSAPLGDGRSYLDLLSPEISPSRPARKWGPNTGQCDHCGAYLNYAVVYRHVPSGEFMLVGDDCADNTMGWEDRRSLVMARAKKAMAAARANAEEQRRRAEGLAEVKAKHPEAFAILDGYKGSNDFIADVATRMARWGRLKREGDMSKIADAIVRAHERDQQRSAERADAADVPEGRFVIEGTVLSVKTHENAYGERLVWTVKHDDGWLVWGTIPRGCDADKGDHVRFTGTVTRSDRDPKFGFVKRPTKAEIIEGGE